MNEVDEFLRSVIERRVEADTALHNGDAGSRKALWSAKDPVTLFGAMVSATGRDHVAPVFDALASSFSNARTSNSRSSRNGEWKIVHRHGIVGQRRLIPAFGSR